MIMKERAFERKGGPSKASLLIALICTVWYLSLWKPVLRLPHPSVAPPILALSFFACAYKTCLPKCGFMCRSNLNSVFSLSLASLCCFKNWSYPFQKSPYYQIWGRENQIILHNPAHLFSSLDWHLQTELFQLETYTKSELIFSTNTQGNKKVNSSGLLFLIHRTPLFSSEIFLPESTFFFSTVLQSCCLIVIFIFFFLWPTNSERTLNGKKLSYWIVCFVVKIWYTSRFFAWLYFLSLRFVLIRSMDE